jgi:hypothetical protein
MASWKDDLALDAMFLRVMNGLRGLVTQDYNSVNVKKGVQYELSGNTAVLADGASIDTIFTTGPLPVIIKSRLVKFNGTSIATRVYRAPTYTGGTITPYFNLNDIGPVTGGATIRTTPTVSAVGTEFGAPTFDIGSAGVGNTSLSTYTVTGIERVLRPNTTYLQRITNDSGAAQRVSSYLTWFEGTPDFPNTDYA